MSVQVTPLRQRMIGDMTIRNMSPLTKKSYVRAVKNFSKFFRQSPDKLTFEHVRAYQLHLVSRDLGVQATNQIMCALRFFYGTTLGRARVSEHIPLGRRPDALPPVLAREEVERFLKSVNDLEFRTAFVTIYATGLRVSEAVALTIKDINSARMVIHIRQGKGRKDRYVMLRTQEWVVYAKRPFAGPKQVLAYLARYTHRVAIANSRLLDLTDEHVSFRWKDYRENGDHKNKVMKLAVGDFMRRFLLHVLPDGFHRIRHYGLFASGHRADKLVLCRSLLQVPTTPADRDSDDLDDEGAPSNDTPPCPCCGGRMKIIESFDGLYSRPFHARRADSS